MAEPISDDKPETLALRRLQAWWAATPDMVAIINREGYYTELVSGVSVKPMLDIPEIVGKHYSEIGNPERRAEFWSHACAAMDTGKMQTWVFERPEEQPGVHYEARFVGLGSDECLVKIRDISDWHFNHQKLKDEVEKRTASLQQSNDELRQFAYAASHDLREPLGKIKAFGGRLEERYADQLDAKGREYLGVMRSAADRMMRLIDDLLSYSRVGQDVKYGPVSLNDVLGTTQSLMQLENVHLEVSPNLPEIWGDPVTLGTLFQNLISNAIKFRKPDTEAHIRISSSVSDNLVVISVEDDGIGFEPQYAEKIFQIFERLHTRFNIPGTGIGLALCKRIMDQHGGYIQGEGRPGEGSIFRLAFPRDFPC